MPYTFAAQYGPQTVLSRVGGGVVANPGVSVNVYLPGTTTKATLYTDRTKGTAASNPVVADAGGNLTFFADPGRYDINFIPIGSGVATTLTVELQPDYAEPNPAPFGNATYVPLPGAAQNPLTGWFHADGYGAVGDNTADCTTAIQAALNAAGSVTPKKAKVYIPSGRFKTNALTMSADTEIFGPGELVFTSTTTVGMIAPAARCVIRDLTLTDPRTYAGNPILSIAINANNVDSVTIENCRISGFKSAGVNFGTVTNGRVVGNRISSIGALTADAGDGIDLYRCATAAVAQNQITTCGKHAINLYGDVGGGSSDVAITGNICTGNGDVGIRSTYSVRTAVTGNQCSGNGLYKNNGGATGGAGINFADGTTDATIVGNVCENNTEHGIIIQNSAARFTVGNNLCTGNAFSGIKVVVTCSDVTITGNLVKSNTDHGLEVNGSTRCTVVGNTVELNSLSGIHVTGAASDVTVLGNSIRDNNQATGSNCGILLDGTTPTDVAIIGNTSRASGGTLQAYGIRVFTGDHITIQGNVCRGNSTGQITVDSAGVNISNVNNIVA